MTNNSGGRAPPGGYSTFSFGGDTSHDANAAPTSANRYARGSDQNSGNVMTGYPTTRVHAPPGGKSTVCFDDGHVKSPPRAPPAGFTTRGSVPGITESLQRGQIPTGGVQTHKFGTPSPMPHSVRHQPTFEGKYRFSDVGSVQEANYDAPPVGGKAEICLGTAMSSPLQPQGVPVWPGASPTPAGMEVKAHTTTTNAEPGDRLPPGGLQHNIFNRASLDANPTTRGMFAADEYRPRGEFPLESTSAAGTRIPPGGLQHNIFNRESLAADPRMVPAVEEPPSSGRMPPGGRSNIIFGSEQDSIPMVQRAGGAGEAPRVLEQRIQEMGRGRAPPGGASTIALG